MLDHKLRELADSDFYPFHMPGHKRQQTGLEDPYAIDITEIPGFDNLHDPQGLILEAMERMAGLYHAKKSYLLVGGSTCGNLTAVFSALPQKGCILMGRGSHKSIYHAAWLRQCRIVYTYPKVGQIGMIEGTSIAEYEQALQVNPDIGAIVVTSPTYEGMIEPLDEIVALAHARGIPVIVDAAHGAHLGFDPYFPKSPLESGADLVIMSLHKTLPALTQTAVLHVNENSLVSERQIETYLDVFETSSPSYVLMASICQCIRFLEEEKAAFGVYASRLQDFYKKCKSLEKIRVSSFPGQDPGKIVIDVSKTWLSGHALEEILLQKYHLVLEMSSFSYGLAMTSVMDSEEGFVRLFEALKEIDREASARDTDDPCRTGQVLYGRGHKVMEYHEALEKAKERCALDQAEGRIAASSVAIYPPGVPLIVPGERIDQERIDLLNLAQKQGLTITGLVDHGLFVVI